MPHEPTQIDRLDRHSCKPTSHCDAHIDVKREGAGSKHSWGRVTDTDGPIAIDQHDPNYDSSEELNKSTRR